MDTYIKLYNWTANLGLTLEERFVYSLVLHFTEKGIGYFAGTKGMTERLNIPGKQCRSAIKHLQEIGAVSESRETIHNQTRKILRANKDFITKNRQNR